MAVDIWVLAASIQQSGSAPGFPAVAPTNKGYDSGFDDTVAWYTPASASQARPWRLTVTPAPVVAPHGAITQVRLYARMFTSQAGPSLWYDDAAPYPAPYYAPFVDLSGAKTFYTPESYGGNQKGVKITGNLNTNNPGSWSPNALAWDITSLATWDDAVLASVRFGMACDNESLAYNRDAGLNIATQASMSAPLFQVSQLVLRVTAADPPPAAALTIQTMVGE